MKLTQQKLRSLFVYDTETGLFYCKERRSTRQLPGQIAGCANNAGYVHIKIDYKSYKAHRLAWLYMTGEVPAERIDHINGNPSDNRWCNLRLATHSQNIANSKRPATNTSGYKGVSWHKRTKKWAARIGVGGTRKFIGYYDTPEEAHRAYVDAAEKTHGVFARAA